MNLHVMQKENFVECCATKTRLSVRTVLCMPRGREGRSVLVYCDIVGIG